MSLVTAPAQAPDTERMVLDRAVAYVSEYERAFSAVVSEERYAQRIMGPGSAETRQLVSDVILMHTGPPGWFIFRDVYEVDGGRVRDRDDRVLNLLLKPSPDAFAQAKRIADEGARFNLGPMQRTINTPTLALMFLRSENVSRSAFRVADHEQIVGIRSTVLRFDERALPRLVETRDNAPGRGRFWIDPETGRVLKTELALDSAGTSAVVAVTYAHQPALGLWVPILMAERYRMASDAVSNDYLRDLRSGAGLPGGMVTVEGTATYSNFRRFSIDVTTVIRR